MKSIRVKIGFSAAFIAIIAARLIWPTLAVDTTTLLLLAGASLPWLSSIIKSAELPGGWKIEFREVEAAGSKVITSAKTDSRQLPSPSYLAVSEADSNLLIVGLRIEIEKRLRTLAAQHSLRETKPLMSIVNDLRSLRILRDPVLSGLQELIMAGNKAAHGAEVDPEAAQYAREYGPQVLAVLDEALDG